MKKEKYILPTISLLLLLLWIPAALDKLWDLPTFHHMLLRQPFPGWWADVLFWIVPVLELLAAALIVWPQASAQHPSNPLHGTPRRLRRSAQGFALSTVLLLAFSVFVLLGVLGWYDKRPCSCGSLIQGMGWEQHLWFNLFFLLLSAWGYWICRRVSEDIVPYLADAGFHIPVISLSKVVVRLVTHGIVFSRWHRRRFALFPGRPVPVLNYVTTAARRQMWPQRICSRTRRRERKTNSIYLLKFFEVNFF